MKTAVTKTVATPADLPRHVALLRGINVGGTNKLPMSALATIFTDAGCSSVRTYIQSGNVVFSAETIDDLGPHISAEIRAQFGIHVPVILRSAAEMDGLLHDNPFVKAGVAAEVLHVYFLADAPSARDAKTLDPERSPGDSFVVSGREIYLHLPGGVARTKLTNVYFDKALGTVSTMRNWRTVGTLREWLGFFPDDDPSTKRVRNS